jgi:hypothetical protein
VLQSFYNAKSVFSSSMVSRDWDISLGIDPCFPLAGGLCKLQIVRQGNLVQYKQQANPLYSMQN